MRPRTRFSARSLIQLSYETYVIASESPHRSRKAIHASGVTNKACSTITHAAMSTAAMVVCT